jgi:hypothetical protein
MEERRQRDKEFVESLPFADLIDQPYVYFLQMKKGIKIGFSSNLKDRVGSMAKHEKKPYLLGIVDGDLDDEQRIHWRFAHQRIAGEIFKNSEEIRDFVEERMTEYHRSIVSRLNTYYQWTWP